MKGVLVKINRFVGPDSKPSKLNYYKDGFYIRYITREDAVCKHDLSLDELKQLQTESNNEEHYQKIKLILMHTGLWNKDGHLSKEQQTDLETTMKKLDQQQHFWDTIISFPKWLVDKFELYTPTQIHEIIKNTINDYFESNNFNPNKMTWFFAFHTNTNNPHIHLGFFETQPQYYNRKAKKYEFRRKGALDTTTKTKTWGLKMQSYLDNDIDYYHLRTTHNQVTKQSKLTWNQARQTYCDINAANNPLKQQLHHLVRIMRKQKNIESKKKLYYNQQSPFIKKKINTITDLLIKDDESLKTQFLAFDQELNNYQEQLSIKARVYATKNKKNGKIQPLNITFKQEQLFAKDGLYARIGNHILNDITDLITNNTPLNPKKSSRTNPNFIPKWPTSTNHWTKFIKTLNKHFASASKQAAKKFQQLQSQVLKELIDNKN